MLPFANSPVPANPTKNSTAAMTMVPFTPIRRSTWEPITAPMQNAIIMMLNVRPTAPFSSSNAAPMGAANMENA